MEQIENEPDNLINLEDAIPTIYHSCVWPLDR